MTLYNKTPSMLDLLKSRIADKPESGKVYLAMFHGRKNTDDVLEDWGESGPLIGPVHWVHFTYSTTISIGFADGVETGPSHVNDGFGLQGDFLYFDGMYYGDWEVQVFP